MKHVGPTYAMSEIRAAMIAWYAKRRADGLTDSEPDDGARFMGDFA